MNLNYYVFTVVLEPSYLVVLWIHIMMFNALIRLLCLILPLYRIIVQITWRT
jgi:hypothetical protein